MFNRTLKITISFKIYIFHRIQVMGVTQSSLLHVTILAMFINQSRIKHIYNTTATKITHLVVCLTTILTSKDLLFKLQDTRPLLVQHLRFLQLTRLLLVQQTRIHNSLLAIPLMLFKQSGIKYNYNTTTPRITQIMVYQITIPASKDLLFNLQVTRPLLVQHT